MCAPSLDKVEILYTNPRGARQAMIEEVIVKALSNLGIVVHLTTFDKEEPVHAPID